MIHVGFVADWYFENTYGSIGMKGVASMSKHSWNQSHAVGSFPLPKRSWLGKKPPWLVGGWALPLWKMWVSQFRLLFHGSKPPTRGWGRHDLPGLIYIYGLGYNIVFNFQRDVKHNRTGRNAWPLTQGIPRESDRTNINFGLNDGLNMLKTLRFDLPQQT
jgi:hypothetical protein